LAVCAAVAIALVLAPTGSASRAMSTRHFACSTAASAKVPCRFSTPSGNIRCLWTPSPNSVACTLLSTGRAYRLRPSGKAKSIHLTLHRRGETLPTDQILALPQSLSCRDTNTSMTCNQDFGFGFFKLARKGSRSA
jgi:hypothetical protein